MLEQVGPEDVLDVCFEELVARPAEQMTRIADFFEMPRGAWIDRAAALVRGQPPTRFDQLAGEEQQKLVDACEPGVKRLAARSSAKGSAWGRAASTSVPAIGREGR